MRHTMAQKTHKARPPARKVERKGEAVIPTNLLRLMDAVGPSRASRELGVSTTTLHKAKKANLVSKSIEVAARAVLRDVVGELSELAQVPVEVAQPARPVGQQRHEVAETSMLLIEVPADKAGMVRRVVEMAHGKLIEP